MTIDLTEYKEYMSQNSDFIKMLKDNESLIYNRYEDIIKTISYIDFLVEKYTNVEEEYETFYEVGFGFLYNQLEEVKLYYKNYFNSNYDEFKNYESVMIYALYADDLKETLIEEELYNDTFKDAYNKLLDKVEEVLQNKLEVTDNLFLELDAILETGVRFKRRILTTTEVYAQIVEELEL